MRNQAQKVIITNFTALGAKYGSDVTRVRKALCNLVEADAARGLKSVVFAIDQKLPMAKLLARPVTAGNTPRQAKRAVDAVCRMFRPDYVLIVGSGDIVPLQPLANPVHDSGGDVDSVVPSDLPYACDGGTGMSVGAYLGPSRVVGRIPDALATSDPSALLAQLTLAADHQPVAPEAFSSRFALSADTWRRSSELSLTSIYGDAAGLHVSPPDGEEGAWPSDLLARPIHFINCHGAPADPRFYGQQGCRFPVAHTAQNLVGRVTRGTVVAAECCYGAEIYDARLASGQPSIAETYLAEGAAGFFGSTTIAYGPPDSNDGADLICRYFLQQVLGGASLGRAALEARLQFLYQSTPLDPYNAKTVAQFVLLGDPSLHPVAVTARPPQLQSTKGKSLGSFLATGPMRTRRRERLFQLGRLVSYLTTAPDRGIAAPPSRIRLALLEAAAVPGRPRPKLMSFVATPRTGTPQSKILQEAFRAPKVRFFCAVSTLDDCGTGPSPLRIVVATEIGGSYSLHTLLSR